MAELSAEALRNRRLLVTVAILPATTAAVLVLVLRLESIPVWLTALATTLIISIEALIAWFTFQLAQAAIAAKSAYDSLMKTVDEVREPLEKLKTVLLDWKDLLPLVADIANRVPKEDLEKVLLRVRDYLDKESRPKPDEPAIEAAVGRILNERT